MTCCEGWRDDVDDDEACYQQRVPLGVILAGLAVLSVAALMLGTDVMYDWQARREFAVQQPIMSAARIIPQLFDVNGTRVSVSAVRVSEDSDFRLGYCKEYPNDGLGEMRALVQMDVAPGGLPEHGLVMRFEIPMIENTIHEAETLRRCPHPRCGYEAYGDGIGAGSEFYNAAAVFLTDSNVIHSRSTALPFPVVCGCSDESPARFSCTMSTLGVAPDAVRSIKGGIAVVVHFMYEVLE